MLKAMTYSLRTLWTRHCFHVFVLNSIVWIFLLPVYFCHPTYAFGLHVVAMSLTVVIMVYVM